MWLNEDRLFQLWDELYDIGTAPMDRALTHCKRVLCDWIGAQNAYWIGAMRMSDGQHGKEDASDSWCIASVKVLNAEYTTKTKWSPRGASMSFPQELGEAAQVVMGAAGSFRVYSLGTGLVDMDAFRQTEHYDRFYRQPGIADRMWVVFPVNNNVESVFVFDRHDRPDPFSEFELQLAAAALRGLKWFHRALSLSHGLGPGQELLKPAERRVLPHLLSGASEKVISERLNLTPSTVHQYANAIYHKYGVRGRANFMALWLRACT